VARTPSRSIVASVTGDDGASGGASVDAAAAGGADKVEAGAVAFGGAGACGDALGTPSAESVAPPITTATTIVRPNGSTALIAPSVIRDGGNTP